MNLKPKITRPALIIGLGGTGQWICTCLKKNLLEYNRGTMPDHVKVLAFDTIAQPQARQQGASGASTEKDIRIGDVELIPNNEFIHLGKTQSNIFGWLDGIATHKKHKHISSWLQAEEYMSTLPKNAFDLTAGAGQIRQFGRMAIFNDLSMPANSSIWARIRTEMKSIAGGVDSNNKLEVIIAGSFAGGTGAGMFIDMAVLLRSIAKNELQNDDHFIVRGFFVLPSVFGLSGQDYHKLEMQARSFAAWRELDRFMIKSPNFGTRSMEYHEEDQALKNVKLLSRPFDACYLVDSIRPNNTLNVVAPEDGVFPSIADVISAILDPVSGKYFTEHITVNLSPVYLHNKGIPLYSTIGSFSVKVPIYYTLEEVVHTFALDALDQWLAPVLDKKERVTGVSSAMNKEVQEGKQGLEEALPFLQLTRVTRGDDGVSATIFFKHIADILTKESINRGKLVETYALTKGVQTNLGLLTNIGDSVLANEIKAKIKSILEAQLANQVKLSRELKENPVDGLGRVERGVTEFLQKIYGKRLENGKELRGEYGNALGECRRYQRVTYRSMLALYVYNLLMGASESEPSKARQGKLGYTYDFTKRLVEHFDTYKNFLKSVDVKRQEGGANQRIYTDFDTKLKIMRQKADKKMLFGTITAPEAHKVQEEYIKAGQAVADLRRDDLLLLVAQETADDMQAATIEMRDLLRSWITTLAVGSPDNPSLYDRVRSGLNYILQGRELEKAKNRIQDVIENKSGSVAYVRSLEALNNMLGRIRWKVYDNVENPGKPNEAHDFKVECVFIKGEESLPMESNNILTIVNEWLTNSRKEYEYLPSQKMVGDVLVEKYGVNGATTFAKEISDKAGPLWQPEAGKAGPKVKHTFLRAFSRNEDPAADETDPKLTPEALQFLDDLKGSLGQLDGATNLTIEMVNSGDPYKVTFIRTDDCIPSDHFKVWHTLRTAYISHITKDRDDKKREMNAKMLHTFPNEVNAAEYEARWAGKGHAYEVFAPEVVMVLSNKKYARLFVLAKAAGLITADRDERAMVLNSAEGEKIFLNQGDEDADKMAVDDIFATMDVFVNLGKDVRSGITTPIPFNSLRPVIVKQVEKNGKYIDFLKKQVDGSEGTLYSELVNKYKVTSEVKYQHLAEVVRFMFQDELADEEKWAN